MILTFSSIQTFKTCRRRYQYRYVDGLELRNRPLYFDFGSATHIALAAHYHREKPDDVVGKINQYFADNAPAQDDSERMAKWIEARELLTAMYQGYVQRYPGEPFRTIDVEMVFELPIAGDTKLAGKIDLLVEENGLWIVEHKTAKTIDVNYKRRLTLDPQSMVYLEAMERVIGRRINGVIYNVLAKTVPHKPEMLKSGALSKAKTQNTTPELYREAVKESNLSESDYSEFIEFLESNRREYFYREYLTFTEEDRAEWKAELLQIVADIENAGTRNAYYKNTAQCVVFGTCLFFEIFCSPDKQFVIENSYEKKEIHGELEEGVIQ